MTNETYSIEVTSPLLRPGITIRTLVSKQYIVEVTRDLLDIVRDINRSTTPVQILRPEIIDRLVVNSSQNNCSHNTCSGPHDINTSR
jgi:hypothetical protein